MFRRKDLTAFSRDQKKVRRENKDQWSPKRILETSECYDSYCSECTTKTIDLRTRWGSVTLALSIFSTFSICMYSWIPYTTKTDTQGYRAGLADAMLSHLMKSHIVIQKLTNQSVCFIRSLTCILYTSILTFTHFSRFKHIYNNYTFSLYHITYEFKKPFIISFTVIHFIQLNINELFRPCPSA